MLFQGIYNIFNYSFDAIDIFYDNVQDYVKDLLNREMGINDEEESGLDDSLEEILHLLAEDFKKWGISKKNVERGFLDQYSVIMKEEKDNIKSNLDLFKKKVIPIVEELFMKKICDYIAEMDNGGILIKLREKNILPLEFMVEIKDLKERFQNENKQRENFRKYTQIRDKIIDKFKERKKDIESLEKLRETENKLQLLYLIFRIVDFFHLANLFDFSNIKKYLKSNLDDWLVSLPLISLKNPDLYYCGIYLADHFDVEIDNEKVEKFLLDLKEEIRDEYESPILEGTDVLYYLLKSLKISNINLKKKDYGKLLKVSGNYLDSDNLRSMETSRLIVILKILRMCDYYEKVGSEKIDSIRNEIEERIDEKGIKQFRNEIFTAEATYYGMFSYYMEERLDELECEDLLDMIVERIYQNLELITFSKEVNHDLFSEILYSLESLRFINCIKEKNMFRKLAQYLFPKTVREKIENMEEINDKLRKFTHIEIDRVTGEISYNI